MADLAQIESLKQLQVSLNESIDRCVNESNKTNGKPSAALTIALEEVQKQAYKLKIAASHPVAENLQRGLEPTVHLALRIAIDLKLIELIDGPISLDELAKKTSADPVLLLRVLRLLRATEYVEEGPQGYYRATPLLKALRIPPLKDWIKTTFDILQPCYDSIPDFLAANNYKDMQDLAHNAFLSKYGDNFFDFLEKNPKFQVDFDSAMGLQDFLDTMAIPQYPFHEALPELSKASDAVTLIDMGGGRGQYLTRLRNEHLDLPGRFILQDLPATTAKVNVNEVKFEVMPHDFFTPQPIQGAKFYHLRGILHDWPDAECLKILKNLRPALKPGYSKLLVQTLVLSRSREVMHEVMQDVNLWVCCGMERDEQQWEELLNKGGFKVDRIIKAEVGSFAIIEADLM